MNNSQPDSELLYNRILEDVVPRGVPSHCTGATDDNSPSVLGQAAKQVLSGWCNCFTMMRDKGAGFSGGPTWKTGLRTLVGSLLITIYQLPYGSLKNGQVMINTLGEALAVVRFAKQQGWESIVVIAPPFHQLRVFLSFVTVALREYPELKIYNLFGLPLDLREKVSHSQGVLRATREELAEIEKKKIIEYQGYGWLASYAAAMQYLNQRDAH